MLHKGELTREERQMPNIVDLKIFKHCVLLVQIFEQFQQTC